MLEIDLRHFIFRPSLLSEHNKRVYNLDQVVQNVSYNIYEHSYRHSLLSAFEVLCSGLVHTVCRKFYGCTLYRRAYSFNPTWLPLITWHDQLTSVSTIWFLLIFICFTVWNKSASFSSSIFSHSTYTAVNSPQCVAPSLQ